MFLGKNKLTINKLYPDLNIPVYIPANLNKITEQRKFIKKFIKKEKFKIFSDIGHSISAGVAERLGGGLQTR